METPKLSYTQQETISNLHQRFAMLNIRRLGELAAVNNSYLTAAKVIEDEIKGAADLPSYVRQMLLDSLATKAPELFPNRSTYVIDDHAQAGS